MRMRANWNRLVSAVITISVVLTGAANVSATDTRIEQAIEALYSSDSAVGMEAASVLERIGSEAVQALAEVARDRRSTSYVPRWLAVRTLGNIGGVEAVPALIEALTDSHTEVRKAAVTALERIGVDAASALPMLAKALNDPNENIRAQVAKAIGAIGAGSDEHLGETVRALALSLGDGSTKVAWAVTQALRKLVPGADHVSLLISVLEDESEDILIRAQAAQALQRVAGSDQRIIAMQEYISRVHEEAERAKMARLAGDPIASRVIARTYPSVFQAWNPADNLAGEDPVVTVARHDLIWHAPQAFGLVWEGQYMGLARSFSPASIEVGRAYRQRLLDLNPNLILLAEIRYHDAPDGYIPADSSWWKRDAQGNRIVGWEEGNYYLLDFGNPEFIEQVSAQAKAAVDSGVVDGIMLDWWSERGDELADRLALVKAVREAIGEDKLIIGNSNDLKIPVTAPYVNGLFMECYRTDTPEDWERIRQTLAWADENLREPRVNCLETWYHNSRNDLNLMRATTTLGLTHSDGYVLFSDPNPLPTPDHLHNWYSFWDRSLGKPLAKGLKRDDGAYQREYENGTVVYNPPTNGTVTVEFSEERTSLATGVTGRVHTIAELDGDIFLF